MNSKKVGVILAALFILGLSFTTIYSRWRLESGKPLLEVCAPQSLSLEWTYETRSTIEPANELHASHGAEWTIDVYIPLYSFEEHMSELLSTMTYATADSVGEPERLIHLSRQIQEDGGYIYTYKYTPSGGDGDGGEGDGGEGAGREVQPGEGVTVLVSVRDGILYFDTLLPFSAIHQDAVTGGYYIFTVSQRDSAWGKEYIISRYDVQFNTPARVKDMACILYLNIDGAPVVTASDRPLHDGELVRLSG